jgi:hypothetical protein
METEQSSAAVRSDPLWRQPSLTNGSVLLVVAISGFLVGESVARVVGGIHQAAPTHLRAFQLTAICMLITFAYVRVVREMPSPWRGFYVMCLSIAMAVVSVLAWLSEPVAHTRTYTISNTIGTVVLALVVCGPLLWFRLVKPRGTER